MTTPRSPDDPGPAARRGNPDRVVTFTDGVFAIVITILVLDIRVPDLDPGESLGSALTEVRPTLVSFVISFLLVGMYWVWHRDTFAQVRSVNRDVVWLNLLFLLPVSMIPFAASLLGEFSQEPAALHAYGATLIAVTVFRVALYWYLFRHPMLLWQKPSEHSRRVGILVATAPIVVYLVAIAVADPLPGLSLALYASLPLAYFALITVLRGQRDTRAAAEDYS